MSSESDFTSPKSDVNSDSLRETNEGAGEREKCRGQEGEEAERQGEEEGEEEEEEDEEGDWKEEPEEGEEEEGEEDDGEDDESPQRGGKGRRGVGLGQRGESFDRWA